MRTLIATLTFLLCAEATLASALSLESQMGNVELRSCSESGSKCLILKSAKTKGSKIKNMQRLTNPTMQIIDTSVGASEVIVASSGYLDLSENKFSLYQRNGDVLTEIAVNLDTLSIQKMEHK